MGSPAKAKVRTVTTGITLLREEGRDAWEAKIDAAAKNHKAVAQALESASFIVQTTRITANPFEEWLAGTGGEPPSQDTLGWLAGVIEKLGVSFFNCGPARSEAGVAIVSSIVRASPRLSCSADVPCDEHGCVDMSRARTVAAAVLQIAGESEGGLGNFQFCATSMCPPLIPFFPAGYHEGDVSSFAIGCETGNLVAEALVDAKGDWQTARAGLKARFEDQLGRACAVAREAATTAVTGERYRFDGVDASVAPAPDIESLVTGYEAMGLGRFGESGTLALSALITTTLKSLDLPLCGYTGLMLPPLEDRGLAERCSESPPTYRIHDLLLYSAVCGLGLDTVPVPGDVPEGKLAVLYADMAALAHRLRKPLSVRVFPVPGKAAGEMTEFDSPYLCNGRVFAVP